MRHCVLNVSGQNNAKERFKHFCNFYKNVFNLVKEAINNEFGFSILKEISGEQIEDYLDDELYFQVFEIDRNGKIIIQGSV